MAEQQHKGDAQDGAACGKRAMPAQLENYVFSSSPDVHTLPAKDCCRLLAAANRCRCLQAAFVPGMNLAKTQLSCNSPPGGKFLPPASGVGTITCFQTAVCRKQAVIVSGWVNPNIEAERGTGRDENCAFFRGA